MASEESKYGHLKELGGSDYEIKEGEPDIKGWSVKNPQGLKIGEVEELLFDVDAQKVRYLIVDLDDNELELDNNKKVLIPIGFVELHDGEEDEEITDEHTGGENTVAEPEDAVMPVGEEHVAEDEDDDDEAYDVDDDGEVVIVNATSVQLKELHIYEKGNVSPEDESMIRRIFEGPGSSASADNYDKSSFYQHEHFNQTKYYGGDRASNENESE